MSGVTRREFLGYCARLAAIMGLAPTMTPDVVAAVEALAASQPRVLWLQGLSCSGCSVSLLNSAPTNVAEVITRYISLKFHSTLSATTGEACGDIVKKMIDTGGFFLVVEGSLPKGMREACKMSGAFMNDTVAAAAHSAAAIVTVGTCASFGGIPAAANNPTGAIGVPAFLKGLGETKPIVSLPGCPCHPDWLVGTLVAIIRSGLGKLDLDEQGRPKMFYGHTIHEQCPRFADYERERFAKKFGEEGCLFQLGCQGPRTYADCTTRQWNGGTNTCIKAGAPCISCASPMFARNEKMPFYTYRQDFNADITAQRKGEKE
ncbi:MAG: hydrogenase small subunit [Candidatus Riflebacteria bacterium]|nr:hydrogenase small subunit [Candidatus Riflebacteria bacterium]